ncbi:hypothetical protein [uncultured Polaribacter sp.]|uniref:hypothetical protein n=1 Tax=uncultured Polaribacter sp. TaxID=174711 RepID=UPI00260529FA|nr:hypothetical protein [uncultured Polaribacter sp.]
MSAKQINVFLLFCILLFSNCATLLVPNPPLNYVGNYYAPTENISLVFKEEDIDFEYTVMGFLTFTDAERGRFFGESVDYNQLITEKAKAVGADAVLVTNFYNTVNSEVSEDILDKTLTLETRNLINVKAKFLKFKN